MKEQELYTCVFCGCEDILEEFFFQIPENDPTFICHLCWAIAE